MKPIRVLMTADTVGSVWTYALELVRALGDRAVFALATMGAPLTRSQRGEAAALSNLIIFESDYQLEWMDAPWQDMTQAGEWLLQLEADFSPDIIHLNGYAHGSLDWKAPALIVGHSCVCSWWKAVKGERAPSAYDSYRQAVRQGIRGVSAVVAPTHAMLSCLEANYGALPPSMVIPNGRSTTPFSIRTKQPFVLSAGRLCDDGKNIVTLAKAAACLSWQVLIAGDNVRPDDDQVHFPNVQGLGRLSSAELARWMSRASIFALPARYEPFGLSPLEAALSGCALVLGDIPSLREVWGDAALFVPPNDEQALARAINHLITSPYAREALAACALERACTYRPDKFARRYFDLYQQLIFDQRSIASCEFASSTTH